MMKNNKRPTFEDFKRKVLQDPEVKAAYDLLKAEFELLEKLVQMKKRNKEAEEIA